MRLLSIASVLIVSGSVQAVTLPPNSGGNIFSSMYSNSNLLLQDGVRTVGTTIILDKIPHSPKSADFVGLHLQLKPFNTYVGDPLTIGIQLPDNTEENEKGAIVMNFSGHLNGKVSGLSNETCRLRENSVRCSLGDIEITEGRRYALVTKMTPVSLNEITIASTVIMFEGNSNLGEYPIGSFTVTSLTPTAKAVRLADPFVFISEKPGADHGKCNEIQQGTVSFSELFFGGDEPDTSLPFNRETMGAYCGAEVEFSPYGYAAITYGQ